MWKGFHRIDFDENLYTTVFDIAKNEFGIGISKFKIQNWLMIKNLKK